MKQVTEVKAIAMMRMLSHYLAGRWDKDGTFTFSDQFKHDAAVMAANADYALVKASVNYHAGIEIGHLFDDTDTNPFDRLFKLSNACLLNPQARERLQDEHNNGLCNWVFGTHSYFTFSTVGACNNSMLALLHMNTAYQALIDSDPNNEDLLNTWLVRFVHVFNQFCEYYFVENAATDRDTLQYAFSGNIYRAHFVEKYNLFHHPFDTSRVAATMLCNFFKTTNIWTTAPSYVLARIVESD